MNEKALADLQDKAEKIRESIWDEGLLRTTGPGNSEKTRDLKFHHSIKATAQYFALGKFTGNIDTNTGTNILSALERVQINDENDKLHGAFPKYSEGERPVDGRYVFSIIAPLHTVKEVAPGSLSLGEAAIIERILLKAAFWLTIK